MSYLLQNPYIRYLLPIILYITLELVIYLIYFLQSDKGAYISSWNNNHQDKLNILISLPIVLLRFLTIIYMVTALLGVVIVGAAIICRYFAF